LGLKEFAAWNKATIAKLIWAITEEKDNLWVKWLQGRHIREKPWWDFIPTSDSSWYWKKICHVKEVFKQGCTKSVCLGVARAPPNLRLSKATIG